ncbi:3' exoribonuclease family protein [Spironucleus salmonicida]|uniref:3' exoribonuclease family protein n=1 Tax=Spironucleus salmonicida TaxID=348837 RepID=V6LR06_9EUKA|nr:3' exoribonuclease family protein [Spironucleus salmonicida]|eukprot:EST46658.1 3' exoribonuclease family protein [Spironucleus salmonicida]
MLRIDCRKQYDLRDYKLLFPSRLGVTIIELGRTIVQAVVIKEEIPPTAKNTGQFIINSPFTHQTQFFVDRVLRQLLPLSTLQITPNKLAYKITLTITILTDDGCAASAAVTAGSAALLSSTLQVQFVPICVFFVPSAESSASASADPSIAEGEPTLMIAYDKSGSIFMMIGDATNCEESAIQGMGASALSVQMEDAVQSEIEKRRRERRARYLIK